MDKVLSKRAQSYAQAKYRATLPLLKTRGEDVAGYMEKLEDDEKVLLQFLYGTMPIADAADYAPDLLHAYVKHALLLRREVPWTRELPEDIFLNYVLYHRVNNEDITDCRAWFHQMLRPLVEDRGLEDAVKEVNYWCAGQAAYAASDERTLGPVGVFNSGTGRCGEESTFLVTALRSVGIAARQVYTPRWAHCDDNHAWVEARVEGRWRFLGACEPEEGLDKGWFTNASSRAMLIHTRVFSDYQAADGQEHITERSGAALFYNDTHNYAKVKTLTVEVCDPFGAPVRDARVEFQLLNMAEYYPISVLYTDASGRISLALGLGSVHIQASMGEQVSQAMVNTETADLVKLTLSESAWRQQLDRDKADWQFVEHVAPRDYPMHPVQLTPQQKKTGRVRKAEAEAHRQRKLQGFHDEERYRKHPGVQDILRLAYGNAGEIYDFLEKHPGAEAERLLRVLSVKDYRDSKCEILSEHLEYAQRVKSKTMETYLHGREDREALFDRYVANPRIGFEAITAYRSFLSGCLTPEQKERFFAEPEAIAEWIREICGCEASRSYASVVTSPAGVVRTRQGSAMAEKTLFVAVCRTLGVPARINPVTREAEYDRGGVFCPISIRGSEEKEEQTLVRLTLLSEESPAYFSRWTIGKLTAIKEASREQNVYTGFQTLDYWGEAFQEGRLTLHLPEGIYRILTTTRLPNGNQLEARRILDTRDFLPASDGVREYTMELVLRQPELSQMLEELPLEEFTLKDETGEERCFSSLTAGRDTLLAFLETGMEPTEHLLNELLERPSEVRESGLTVLFVVQGKESLAHPTFADTLRQIPAQVYYDTFQELPELLARRMYTDPEKLPLVLLISPDRKGRFACSGYNVGSVELALRIARLLPS